MKYNVDISIVIVNYNGFDLLDNCLSSLYKFTTNCTFEIIVVDNNSSQSDVGKVISQYKHITLIRNDKNIGFAAANNLGIYIARGKYILLLNNDTVFHENTLKILYDFAEQLKQKIFIGCKLLNEDGSHQISLVDFDTIINSFGENFFIYKLFPKSKLFNRFFLNYKQISKPVEVDVVKGAFIFCSADALKKLNGFDSSFYFYGEETDLCFRFKELGGKIFYHPGTSIYHVGGASTVGDLWFKFKNQSTAKIKIYQKHYDGLEAFLLKSFHFTGMFLRVPLYLLGGISTFNFALIKKSCYYFRTLFIYPKNNFK